jgi:tetratricopeptide (TPR) repeat protein
MADSSLTVLEAFNHAVVAYNAGRLPEAEALCRRVIAAKDDFFEALHLSAIIQSALGQNGTAVSNYNRALSLRPDSAEALSNRGLALHGLQRFDEALVSYEAALAVRPNYAKALYNRSNTLMALQRYEDALNGYQDALAIQPNYADALVNRAVTLHELKRFEEALTSYENILTVQPDFVEVLFNRGNTFLALQRFDESLSSYDRALAIRPDYAEVLCNRGKVFQELRRFDEAVSSYEGAIRVRQDYPDAHYNHALCLLLTGDFERGWTEYEWRWRLEQLKEQDRRFSQPLWLGDSDIANKIILLHAEQGFGDTIQFSRYVPFVAALGARVVLEVPTQLYDLMKTLEGVTQIIARGDALPDFDLRCPLLSLPLAFNTRKETIPSTTPYLHALSPAITAWDARLGPKRRPRIGLAWSGSLAHKNDQYRSMSLSTLLPLLDVDATFVSLQKDVRSNDVATLHDRSDILDVGGDLRDFSDTAALIANLDLIISVDTSVVHLAGALGKPVWILLPFIPDWRWLLDRNDSLWYPTVQLFRQDETRSWPLLVNRVREKLKNFIQLA